MPRWAGSFLALLAGAAADPTVPRFHGCVGTLASSMSYCNSSLPVEARVEDLLSAMTLQEKIYTIAPDPQYGSTCAGHMHPIDRLGVPGWSWLTETNSQVSAGCISDSICPTTFVGNLGMAASFNRSNWRTKGQVMGVEMRAFNNLGAHRGEKTDFVSLTGFGPNINIARDPRFGRTSELPGEDPTLNGLFATEVVQGMQQRDASGRVMMLAYLKHFTAYSTETGRGHDSYNISTFDMWDSFLPQYELAMRRGNASGVMCSYDAENGAPSCANGWLLNHVLRGWAPAAVVATDCGAVSNLLGAPVNAASPEEAAAFAINNGTDVELGSTLFLDHLQQAVQRNLTSEVAIEAAARRVLTQHFRAGRFDPLASLPAASLGVEHINSTEHQRASFEAALQSFVLLKNSPAPLGLPLKQGLRLAVLGPQAVTRAGLLPDYAGNDRNANTCMSSRKPSYDCMSTIAESLAAANVGGSTSAAQGVPITADDTSGAAAALELAAAAEAVVLVLGIDKTVEHEGVDRTDTALPGKQSWFAQQVLQRNKRVVLVLVNGGAIAFDELVSGPVAIVEAFNPAVAGPPALAATLFGQRNGWGKLPYTLYPHTYISQQSMLNYDMAKSPGRTYKYYTGAPLWPFGSGLSYSQFDLSCALRTSHTQSALQIPSAVDCSLSNLSEMDGEEVVMLYHSSAADIRAKAQHPVPLRALRDFERLSVKAHGHAKLSLAITTDTFKLVNASGQQVLYSGLHQLILSRGNGLEVVLNVSIAPIGMEGAAAIVY